MSCGVGRRCGSALTLLWLWCRPAPETPIQPLAWELPYVAGVALKKKKKKKETNNTWYCKMEEGYFHTQVIGCYSFVDGLFFRSPLRYPLRDGVDWLFFTWTLFLFFSYRSCSRKKIWSLLQITEQRACCHNRDRGKEEIGIECSWTL